MKEVSGQIFEIKLKVIGRKMATLEVSRTEDGAESGEQWSSLHTLAGLTTIISIKGQPRITQMQDTQ